jgi:hypothetical protein
MLHLYCCLDLKAVTKVWLLSEITGFATAGRTLPQTAHNKKPAIPYTGMAGFVV